MAVEILEKLSFPRKGNNPDSHIRSAEDIESIRIYVLTNRFGRPKKEAVLAIHQAMLDRKIVVGDFGSTFGFMFLDIGREKVRQAKGEEGNKPVSVVSTVENVLPWINRDKLHPLFRDDKIIRRFARALQNIAFLRFPVNDEGEKASQYSVDRGQMQVLFRSCDDPILRKLQEGGYPAYLVTSLNPHGELERYQPHLAFVFAKQIGAEIFILNTNYFLDILSISHEDLNERKHDPREKKGSVPIIQIPRLDDVRPITKAPVIKILRAANTHPYSLHRALRELFPYCAVEYCPDKPERPDRPQYSLSSEANRGLFGILYRASRV